MRELPAEEVEFWVCAPWAQNWGWRWVRKRRCFGGKTLSALTVSPHSGFHGLQPVSHTPVHIRLGRKGGMSSGQLVCPSCRSCLFFFCLLDFSKA